MTSTDDPPTVAQHRSWRFLALFALANAGGVIAYLPLLTLLVPLKAAAIGGDSRIGLLATVMVIGAVTASIANIVFGSLSDRGYRKHASRRRWIVGGLIALPISYGGLHLASDVPALIAAIIGFQVALNMLLAPLTAVMADEVPDTQKGLVGGLLGFASPIGGLAGGAITGVALLGEGGRLAMICGLSVLLIAPLMLFGRFGRSEVAARVATDAKRTRRRDMVFVALSRLSIQIAGNILFAYLLFYFEHLDRTADPLAIASRVGTVTGLAFLVSVPLTIAVGRASDRIAARKPFLVIAALFAACGLAVMALAADWVAAVAGFALFASGSGVFLGLHSAYAMQILPSPGHRARDLGVLNLTNTLPSIIGPPLAWAMIGPQGFGAMLTVLAMMALLGGVLVLPIRSGR